MKYIIMCGGNIEWKADQLRQFTPIKGEPIVIRSIRLLKEIGIEDIAISSNNPAFDGLGVPRLEHNNPYTNIDALKTDKNYWVDAFYPTEEEVCYIFGDVYFSENAIKTIINTEVKDNTLFGTHEPYAPGYFKTYDEPLAYKVVDQSKFRRAIDECKRLQDENKITRGLAIVWHIYRILNDIDVNKHILKDNFVGIHDFCIDIDRPEDAGKIENAIK